MQPNSLFHVCQCYHRLIVRRLDTSITLKLFKNLETFHDENLDAVQNSKTSISFADVCETIPKATSFVKNMTAFFSLEFRDLWKLGQAYFQGDFGADPDPDKSGVFKTMVFDGIQKFCNLIRSAIIPQTFDKLRQNALNYGDRRHARKVIGPWLIQCLRDIRKVKDINLNNT